MQFQKPKKDYKIIKMRFNELEIPSSWDLLKLNQLCREPISGKRPKGGVGEFKEGIVSLGGEHIDEEGNFNFKKIKFVPENFFKKSNNFNIQLNDIVIVKDGATTGRVGFVDKNYPYDESMINEHLFILRKKTEFVPKWLFYFLLSKLGQDQFIMLMQGSAQEGIISTFVNLWKLLFPQLMNKRKLCQFYQL